MTSPAAPTETLTNPQEQTVADAISQSVANNSIDAIECGTPSQYADCCRELDGRADMEGSCEANPTDRYEETSEYWGTDEDGDEWRVHVHLLRADDV